jgi:Raf kinase inhibitor-like YbhB/YbcL family protein
VRAALAIAGALVALGGCGGSSSPTVTPPLRVRTSPKTIILSSPAFTADGTIPRVYTCAGKDIAPPLRWMGIPSDTRELELEMVDRDAPGGQFVHWTLAGIGPSSRGLAAGEAVPPGAVAGQNDFGHTGYGGPCPPTGKPHRYVITLLALPGRSELKPGFSAGALPTSRALARGELTGIYGR